jgi:hypothetical protein
VHVNQLVDGLAPGYRYRCSGCGNVTRFDVVATVRSRAYHHFDLGGERRVEEEEILDRTVEQVVCRWCQRDDTIVVETAPVADAT